MQRHPVEFESHQKCAFSFDSNRTRRRVIANWTITMQIYKNERDQQQSGEKVLRKK